MIKKITIENFKGIKFAECGLSQCDVLVGVNNSHKTTILQALSVFQWILTRHLQNKGGLTYLNYFDRLVIHHFRELFYQYDTTNDIIISLTTKNYHVKLIAKLRFVSDNEINTYFIPNVQMTSDLFGYIPLIENMKYFQCTNLLQTNEILYQLPAISSFMQTNSASVLRNILWQVKIKGNWSKFQEKIKEWFGIEMIIPQFDENNDTYINIYYNQNGFKHEILSAGQGLIQACIILGVFYGFKPPIMLMDEPDNHLHSHIQAKLIEFCQSQTQTQFIIATHSPIAIDAVNNNHIISLLGGQPTRGNVNTDVLKNALRLVSQSQLINMDKGVIYVEGESDIRIIKAFASKLQLTEICSALFVPLGGGTKEIMVKTCQDHFAALKQYKKVKAICLLDNDGVKLPKKDSKIHEWPNRRNIESYLLVDRLWVRIARETLKNEDIAVFIENYFKKNRFDLQEHENYTDFNIEIMRSANGKQLLFEGKNSLYKQLQGKLSPSEIPYFNPENIIYAMLDDEIHNDIRDFLGKCKAIL